jgi:FkbM family methyltransferase
MSVVRAAGYVRDLPSEAPIANLSIDRQRQRIEAHADAMGWELVRVYEDRGAVARRQGLPGQEQLLSELDGLDKVIVVRLDRFARSTRRVLDVIERLKDAGVELVALREEIDTGTPEGVAAARVLESVSKWGPEGPAGHGLHWDPAQLASRDFTPVTVIDVGANEGVPSLVDVFPDAHHVLIEPLREYEPALRQLLENARSGEYVWAAIGAQDGEVEINVETTMALSSVLQVEAEAERPVTERRSVPMRKLDSLLDEREWQGPFGLKIDVEGFEDRVIAGAESLLASTQFVVAEVSVTSRFEGAPLCSEFIGLMRLHGFAVADVIDAHSSPFGIYADLVFERS